MRLAMAIRDHRTILSRHDVICISQHDRANEHNREETAQQSTN